MKLVLVNLCNELKNGTYRHVVFGRVGANTKNKIEKKYFYFFFNFRKFGSVGSVKRKIKKLWPCKLFVYLMLFPKVGLYTIKFNGYRIGK